MYMNLRPNKHKRKSFNTMTIASLGFIGPPKTFRSPLSLTPPNFFAQVPPNLFGPKFLGPLKLGGGCYH